MSWDMALIALFLGLAALAIYLAHGIVDDFNNDDMGEGI